MPKIKRLRPLCFISIKIVIDIFSLTTDYAGNGSQRQLIAKLHVCFYVKAIEGCFCIIKPQGIDCTDAHIAHHHRQLVNCCVS
jgi:hypothetical protein